MRKHIYGVAHWLQRMLLKSRGWELSDNVMISIHGVRKIGWGEYIMLIM